MKFVNYTGEDSFDYELIRSCKNCNQSFSGRYCSRCGEKVIATEDRSILALLKRVFRDVPVLDNKFLRTVRLMILKPGLVSSNYIQGRRTPFIHPLAIFLVINLLYFLFPTFQDFNSPLRTQMHFLSHSTVASDLVGERMKAENTSLTEFTIRYEQHATNVAKIMLVAFVLILTVPFMVVNYTSGYFFRDHIFVSLEFTGVVVLVNYILMPWFWIFLNSIIFNFSPSDEMFYQNTLLTAFMGLISFRIFYLLEKQVYNLSLKRSLLCAILMMGGLFVASHVYYGVVFFITMWTL